VGREEVPGRKKFAQNLEDADAVLVYLREPSNAVRRQIDTKHIVLAGHSIGGWVTVMTAARNYALAGAILVSAADMGFLGRTDHDKLVQEMADNMESLAGVTLRVHGKRGGAEFQDFRIRQLRFPD